MHILPMTYEKDEAGNTAQLAGGDAGRGRGPAAPGCNPPNIGMCERH